MIDSYCFELTEGRACLSTVGVALDRNILRPHGGFLAGWIRLMTLLRHCWLARDQLNHLLSGGTVFGKARQRDSHSTTAELSALPAGAAVCLSTPSLVGSI